MYRSKHLKWTEWHKHTNRALVEEQALCRTHMRNQKPLLFSSEVWFMGWICHKLQCGIFFLEVDLKVPSGEASTTQWTSVSFPAVLCNLYQTVACQLRVLQKKKKDTMSACNGTTEESDTFWCQKSSPFQIPSHEMNINNTSRHLKYFYGLLLKTKVYKMSGGNCVVDLCTWLLWGHLFKERLHNPPRFLLHTSLVNQFEFKQAWPVRNWLWEREYWWLHQYFTAVLSWDSVPHSFTVDGGFNNSEVSLISLCFWGHDVSMSLYVKSYKCSQTKYGLITTETYIKAITQSIE